MIFILIAVILVFISFLNVTSESKSFYYKFSYVFLLLFIFLASIRNYSGADFDSYQEIFYITSSKYDLFFIEPLFGLLGFLVSRISLNFNLYLFIIASISIILKFRFIRNYSPYVFLSILVFYCGNYVVQDMGQIRQGLAIGITFLSFKYLLERKYLYFYLIVLTASLLHYSAMIFFLAPLLVNFNISFYKAIGGWFLSFALGFYLKSFSGSFLGLESLFSNEYAATKFSYIEDKDYNAQVGFSVGMILRLILLILALNINYSKIRNEVEVNVCKMVTNLYFFGGIVYFIFGFVEFYASRLSLYFTIYEILLVPLVLKYHKKTFMFYVVFTMIVVFFLFNLYNYVFEVKTSFLEPFKTIL